MIPSFVQAFVALLLDKGLMDSVNHKEGFCHSNCGDIHQDTEMAGNTEAAGMEDPIPVTQDNLKAKIVCLLVLDLT